MSIIAQEPKIDVNNALDLIGRTFNFDHSKGIAELLKNSYDAYQIDELPPNQQIIILSLQIGGNDIVRKISVIDFCGMTKAKIDKGFIEWFSKTASKLNRAGATKTNINTLGGHGNGGKFYMRQMFGTSSLLTFLDGRLSIFGFNKKKQYGYENGYEDLTIEIEKATVVMGIDSLLIINDKIRNLIDGGCGITVVTGERLKKIRNANVYKRKLIENLVNNPQARTVIRHSHVYLNINNSGELIKLNPTPITPHPNFKEPIAVNCPDKIETFDGDIKVTNERYTKTPILTLNTSAKPLKGPYLKNLNRIDFLGETGVIASYSINEIGHFTSSYIDFIYGECESPILEDKKNNHVTNDREKFSESTLSDAIIKWVNEEINKLAEKMAADSKKNKRIQDLSKTSDLNRILNTWKNQFLKSILKDELFGEGNELGLGGNTLEGAVIGTKQGKESGKKAKKKKGRKGGSDSKKSSGFPDVLISDKDEDPQYQDGRTLPCDERHHAVHQRPWDVINNIYWINTRKPIASKILTKYGPDSPRWRSYLFQMYNDIIIKEAIEIMGKRDFLTPYAVNDKIDEVISFLQEKAVDDLESFLFDEIFDV